MQGGVEGGGHVRRDAGEEGVDRVGVSGLAVAGVVVEQPGEMGAETGRVVAAEELQSFRLVDFEGRV